LTIHQYIRYRCDRTGLGHSLSAHARADIIEQMLHRRELKVDLLYERISLKTIPYARFEAVDPHFITSTLRTISKKPVICTAEHSRPDCRNADIEIQNKQI